MPREPVVKIELRTVEVPKSLRQCEKKPVPPKASSQKAVAAFIVRLDSAYDKCADKVTSIDKILTTTEQSVKGVR